MKYSAVTVSEMKIDAKAKAKVCGRCDVQLIVTIWGNVCKCLFQNILHVPDFEYSLLSVSTMDLESVSITFANARHTIRQNDIHVVTGFLEGSLYVINASVQK